MGASGTAGAMMGIFLFTAPGKKPGILYLQKFVDRDSVTFAGLSAPEKEKMTQYLEILTPFVEKVALRGE